MILAKPGAGLPNIERVVIKHILVPAVRVVFTWDIALLFLKREVNIINKLLENVSSSLYQKKVLIDRTFAIEDDTRQYSLNLVLEHLTIAGNGVMLVIETLSKEKEFTHELTIESVKPKENKENQLKDFLNFYNTYFKFIKNLDKKQSEMTQKHPWFDKFNNFDWSIFMYMHTFIHRRQIEAIIKKLGESNES